MIVMGHMGLWAYKFNIVLQLRFIYRKMRPTHQSKLYQHATKSMILTFWYTAGKKSHVAEKFKSEQINLHPI